MLTKGNGAANLSFTNAPSGADDAPVPRLAMLPNGQYGANVALYPNGPVHADLTRDYIRVGVVDVEGHLVGQARKAGSGASDEASRRADDQNRATTGSPSTPSPRPASRCTRRSTPSPPP